MFGRTIDACGTTWPRCSMRSKREALITLRCGRLRALANDRYPNSPETMPDRLGGDARLPGFVAGVWIGVLCGSSKAPRISRLEGDTDQVLRWSFRRGW